MIIESTDGNYYGNPQIIREDALFGVRDDQMHLFVTSEKKIPKDFKIANVQRWLWEDLIFVDNKLKHCLPLTFDLKAPIPPPSTWETKYTDYLPVGEELIVWSRPFTSIEILDFMAGKDVPSILLFLGPNAKRRIRDQVQFLVGAKITTLNYDSYLRRLPRIIRLKRKDCYNHVPELS